MLTAAFVFISYQFQHLILKSLRHGVSTLAGYTFVLRVPPVLLSALLIVLATQGSALKRERRVVFL
jgi:hypothetical protein